MKLNTNTKVGEEQRLAKREGEGVDDHVACRWFVAIEKLHVMP